MDGHVITIDDALPSDQRTHGQWQTGAMRRRISRHASLAGFLMFGAAFAVWTWMVLRTSWLVALDRHQLNPHLQASSTAAQYWAAFAIITQPGIVAVALLAMAAWAWQRRFRRLCSALVLGVGFTWPASALVKHLVRRVRPPSPLADVVTYHGWSYPSTHMSMAMLAAVMAIAAMTTTRQARDTLWAWRIASVLGVLSVAFCRWVMNAHWPSDIIGGALLGGMTASLAAWLAGLHMIPELDRPRRQSGEASRRAAVIYNPTKVFDRATFRRNLEWEFESRGWLDPLWLQTRADDPGREMAQAAIKAGVDLVVVAGGDGTVRVVCSELASTGVRLAIVPAGTGNLLARNLGVPLDEPSALHVAFSGKARPIDLVKVTIDDEPASADHFAVMAGIGIDARIMDATRPELKRTVGSAAYFLAAPQQLASNPMELTFSVDGGAAQERRAMMAVVGNVGSLQGGIQLFPHASAMDGKLDVVIASPRRLVDWAPMLAKVLTRRPQDEGLVDELAGRSVRIEVAERMPYELDGDTVGTARVFEAEVVPGALQLMLPRN